MLARKDVLVMLPVLLCPALILAIDHLIWNYQWPQRVTAPLDEIGHLATAAVVLYALPRPLTRAFVTGAVLGAALLDLDHVAGALRLHAWAPVYGRPYSHSLAIVLVAVALAWRLRAWRQPLLGAACGLATHVARDLGTGNLPLVWPLTTAQLSVPHTLYMAAVLAFLGWGIGRDVLGSRIGEGAATRGAVAPRA